MRIGCTNLKLIVQDAFDTIETVGRLIPLNTHAGNILNDMPRNHADDFIFPFPYTQTTFQTHRDKIIAAAGLDEYYQSIEIIVRALDKLEQPKIYHF